MTNPANILHKHHTYWISEAMLAGNGVSEEYLRVRVRPLFKKSLPKSQQNKKLNVMPDTGASWRWARWNGTFYYAYNRIPNRAPAFYRSKLPTEEELEQLYISQKDQEKTQLQKNTTEAIQLKADFLRSLADAEYLSYQSEVRISAERANDISYARALCIAIKEFENKYKTLGIRTKGDYWVACTTMVQQHNYYGLNIKNPNSLRNKINNFPEDRIDQLTYLLSGKYGNTNKQIVGKFPYVDELTGEVFKFDIHQAVMFSLWMNPGRANKLNQTGMVGVYEKYAEQIKEFGMDPVAERTVSFHLSRFGNKSMMSLERDGADHYTNTYVPYVPQFIPRFTGSVWVADFSGTKILYKDIVEKWNVNSGKKTTKQVIKSHYMCRITDVATGCLVGWSISETPGERWEDVVPALEMARKNNHGYMAMELITDNGAVWKSPENKAKLDTLFTKHRPIGLGNKQSNKAEFYVKMLSNLAREYDNWSMIGFNAKDISNKANPDYMNPKNYPTKQEASLQIEELVGRWNNITQSNGGVPAHEQARPERLHPKLEKLSKQTLRKTLGFNTKVRVSRMRSILTISKKIGNVQHDLKYKISNWEHVAQQIDKLSYGSNNLEVNIYFNELAADIYTLGGVYVATAAQAELAHSTEFESTDASIAALNSGMADKAISRGLAKEFGENAQEVLANIFEEVEPELDYIQRAALNGGKAKDENLKLQQDELDSWSSSGTDILNQL